MGRAHNVSELNVRRDSPRSRERVKAPADSNRPCSSRDPRRSSLLEPLKRRRDVRRPDRARSGRPRNVDRDQPSGADPFGERPVAGLASGSADRFHGEERLHPVIWPGNARIFFTKSSSVACARSRCRRATGIALQLLQSWRDECLRRKPPVIPPGRRWTLGRRLNISCRQPRMAGFDVPDRTNKRDRVCREQSVRRRALHRCAPLAMRNSGHARLWCIWTMSDDGKSKAAFTPVRPSSSGRDIEMTTRANRDCARHASHSAGMFSARRYSASARFAASNAPTASSILPSRRSTCPFI